MKTIVVFNDNSAAAKTAAQLALAIAQKTSANLWVANLAKVFEPVAKQMQISGSSVIIEKETISSLVTFLKSANHIVNDFKPEIKEINIYNHSPGELAEFIIKNNVWMMVKGLGNRNVCVDSSELNVQHVLNRVMCPLLLVPQKLDIRDFDRIVYMADLRYCRLQVVKYLADLSRPYRAHLIIGHLSAKGLPDIEQNYSCQLFDDTIARHIDYNRLFFNNIREKDIKKAADIMIHGMQVGLLALVNHRFHFEEILGDYIPQVMPEHITIPLIIFPY